MTTDSGGADLASVAANAFAVAFDKAIAGPKQTLQINALGTGPFVLLLEGTTDNGATWNTINQTTVAGLSLVDSAGTFTSFGVLTQIWSGYYRVSVKNTDTVTRSFRVWAKAL